MSALLARTGYGSALRRRDLRVHTGAVAEAFREPPRDTHPSRRSTAAIAGARAPS